MRLLLVLAVAFAGKKKDDTPVHPDPDVIAAEEAEACAKDIPENYRIFTGYASGTDPTTAVVDARNNAVREALDTVCSGKSETRCEVLRRHVADWKKPFHNPLTGKACAHVGIDRLWIDDDKRDQEQLDEAVTALGKAIAEAAPAGKPIAMRAPVWGESGCVAGPLGVVLTSAIRNAIAERGLVIAPVGKPTASEITVVARSAGDRVFVEASVQPWGAKAATPVPGIDVAGDLFPVDEGDGTCWLDSRMGLPGGKRDGANGLHVRIDQRAPHPTVCEGDVSTPEIHVDRPARVKVFSVDRMGAAYLVWPPPGGSDRVAGSLAMDELHYVQSPVGGEERMVAVAVAEGASFPEIDDWTAFCKHPRPFSVTPFAGSAAHAIGFEVRAYDDPACVQRNVPRAAKRVIPEIPVCPRRYGE